MKRSVKVGMLTLSALTGFFVFTGLSGVKVLPKEAPVELLTNPGFESPALTPLTQGSIHPVGWQTFTSGTTELMTLSVGTARSGNQAVKFVSHGVLNFFQGMFQTLPVTPGDTYQFGVYVKGDPAKPLKGSGTGQLSIEWHDANDNEVGRLWSTPWGASLPATEWTRFEVAGAAPPTSATAHYVIVEKGEGQPVSGCVFFVDDASVVKMSEE